MNIMVLDHCLEACAQAHIDSHVNKICTEIYQCVGSALRRHGATDQEMPTTKAGTPLKGGYHNHPVTRWCGNTRENFTWACDCGVALAREFEYRFSKAHFCESKILECFYMQEKIPDGKFTANPQCFGEENKHLISHTAVEGYRKYYNEVKSKTIKMRWTRRLPPYWYYGKYEYVNPEKNYKKEGFWNTHLSTDIVVI